MSIGKARLSCIVEIPRELPRVFRKSLQPYHEFPETACYRREWNIQSATSESLDLLFLGDLGVVVENGVVLVTRRDAPTAVRAGVDALKAKGRSDLL